MSLLQNIPGLARHRSEPAPASFDHDRAFRTMRDAVALLESFYPAGAMEWLREMRPDVAQYLRECAAEVDAADVAEDMRRFRQAVDKYVEAHQRAFKVYETRPPVIEVDAQGGLF